MYPVILNGGIVLLLLLFFYCKPRHLHTFIILKWYGMNHQNQLDTGKRSNNKQRLSSDCANDCHDFTENVKIIEH